MSVKATSDQPISDAALDQLFFDARTQNAWQDREVPNALLKRLVDTLKMAPTSANCSPARFVFVKSDDAKARLKPHLSPGNVDKTVSAPVCVIIGTDYAFYDKLPQLFPHNDARSWFFDGQGNPLTAKINATADRNSTLQGAYLMLAARALGLDCGPMSGFDADSVSAEFFAKQTIKANFLCNLGYGDTSVLFDRSPRFDFDEMASII